MRKTMSAAIVAAAAVAVSGCGDDRPRPHPTPTGSPCATRPCEEPLPPYPDIPPATESPL